MWLSCPGAERTFDLIEGCVAFDTEHGVVVGGHPHRLRRPHRIRDSRLTSLLGDASLEFAGDLLHRRNDPAIVHTHRTDHTDRTRRPARFVPGGHHRHIDAVSYTHLRAHE